MKYKDNLERILFYFIKFKVLTVIIGLMSVYTMIRLIQFSDLKQHAFYISIPSVLISFVMIILLCRAMFTKKLGVTLIYTTFNFIACLIGLSYIEWFNPNDVIV